MELEGTKDHFSCLLSHMTSYPFILDIFKVSFGMVELLWLRLLRIISLSQFLTSPIYNVDHTLALSLTHFYFLAKKIVVWKCEPLYFFTCPSQITFSLDLDLQQLFLFGWGLDGWPSGNDTWIQSIISRDGRCLLHFKFILYTMNDVLKRKQQYDWCWRK